MQVTYKCIQCNHVFTLEMPKPQFEFTCHCGGKGIKTFKGLTTDKEDDNISHAIELMKYATNPSGKQKTII